jgi:hypothetical protein
MIIGNSQPSVVEIIAPIMRMSTKGIYAAMQHIIPHLLFDKEEKEAKKVTLDTSKI